MTRAQSARPVGNDSPGTDRQPSSSLSGSGIVSGTSEVSSTGLTIDAATAGRAAALVGAVVDEHALGDADLVGGQPDTVGGVHRVVEIVDEIGQVGGQRTVVADGHGTGRGVQDGISHDADGYDGHAES